MTHSEQLHVHDTVDSCGSVRIVRESLDGSIQTSKQPNLMMNTSKRSLSRLLGEYPATNSWSLKHMKFGDAVAPTAPDVLDADLNSPILTKPFITVEYLPLSGPNRAVFWAQIDWSEANGRTITEASMHMQNNDIFSRIVLDTPIAKTSNERYTFYWSILF